MKATGKLGALQLSVSGAPVAVLDHRKMAFTLDGQPYIIRRQGNFFPSYELHHGDELLVFAKAVPFVNRYTIFYGDKSWVLKAEELLAKRFGLYAGSTRVGGINPASRWRPCKEATIDLPDELPLAAQVFLVWIVLSKWGEEATGA